MCRFQWICYFTILGNTKMLVLNTLGWHSAKTFSFLTTLFTPTPTCPRKKLCGKVGWNRTRLADELIKFCLNKWKAVGRATESSKVTKSVLLWRETGTNILRWWQPPTTTLCQCIRTNVFIFISCSPVCWLKKLSISRWSCTALAGIRNAALCLQERMKDLNVPGHHFSKSKFKRIPPMFPQPSFCDSYGKLEFASAFKRQCITHIFPHPTRLRSCWLLGRVIFVGMKLLFTSA